MLLRDAQPPRALQNHAPSDRVQSNDSVQGKRLGRAVRFLGEAIAETLWPTRCAVCDTPGAVLCEECSASLPYIDWWRACRKCGSPYGYVQCDVCNPVTLGRIGREALPYAGCASAVEFEPVGGRIVHVYKDLGEQRLASAMAESMCRVVPPSWGFDTVTFVPATVTAVRRRGFDHAELLAREIGERLELPVQQTLERPKTRDQRNLTGLERVENLAGSFTATGDLSGQRFLLVDDVYTTGATMCASTDALLVQGAEEVYCLTFARV